METRFIGFLYYEQKLPSIVFAADRDVIEPYKRYLFLPLDTYENQIGVIGFSPSDHKSIEEHRLDFISQM
jgi:hypothetical protein